MIASRCLQTCPKLCLMILSIVLVIGLEDARCYAVDVTFAVTSDTDDADEVSGGTVHVTDGSSFFTGHVGFRFQNVSIPAGASITSATLEVYSSSGGTTSFSVDLTAQDADNPATFTTASGSISSRPRTSNQTLWSTGSVTYSVGQSLVSPNFASSIQEVIDRAGWSENNALVVVLTPNSGNKQIFKRSGSTTYPPKLHVTYFNPGESAGNLLFVQSNSGSYTTQEQARVAQFENWGYVVTPIHASDSQAAYDSALATADVAYVSEETDSNQVSYKLRDTTVGVLFEAYDLTDEFGLSTGSLIPAITNTLTIVDNTHEITSPFSNGALTFTNTVTTVGSLSGTLAPDLRVLATWSSSTALSAIESGGTLANSYNGSNVAAGRRVVLPVSYIFDWNDLTADGRTIVQSALKWLAKKGDGFVAHWKLDETSGTIAVDSSSYGNDGTVNGTVDWKAAIYGNGHGFDYSDGEDYIEIPNSSSLENVQEGNYTLAAWFKPSDYPPGADPSNDSKYGILIKQGQHLGLMYKMDGTFEAAHYVSGANYEGVTSSVSYQPGQYYHVAIVVDKGAGTVKLYVNGELAGMHSFTPNSSAHEYGAKRWRIGVAKPSTSNEGYAANGVIDDVRIYNKALSDQEVAELYGFLGHWKLDENSGAVATDSTAVDNDGTYSGGAAPGVSGPYPGAGANAAEFDGGSGDKITLPSMEYDLSYGVTMAVWYNKDSLTGSHSEFISLSNGSLADDVWFGLDHTNGLEIFLSDPVDGASSRSVNEGVSPAAGSWQHGVATIDSAGNAIIYRNGVAVASGFVGIPTNVARAQNAIGGSAFGYGNDGRLFDARFYNRVLSPAEVAELYGLIGHWTFDEGSGTTIADSSGIGNDASFNTGTPVWVDGIYGKALEFDGTNDAITNTAVDPAKAGAVSVWIRSDGPPASRQRPWGLGADFEMWQDPDGLVSMDVSTDGYQGGFITTTPLHTAGRWYHIVAQYDADDNSYEIYLNGELHKSGISTWAIVEQTANQLSFGTRTGSTQRFSGALDDFRVYNRQLSAIEVADLYGLVGHWKMDEGFGTTLVDNTAYGNDATINGATWTSDCVGNIGLEFDGAGDTATTNSAFDPPPTGTVAFWLRSAGNPGSRSRPFGVGGDWEMRQEPDGTLSFDLGGEGPDVGAGGDAFVTNEGLSFENRWYHVVAQFDASDDSFAIYINGALVHSGVNGNNMVEQVANILSFGTRTGNTQYWEGALRDFRVYKRWIADSEISELSGLVAYWKLDELSGSIATDSSLNGYDGTLSGSPTWTTAGQIDGALDFETADGTDRIDVEAFDVSGSELSLAAWVRPENSVNDGRIIMKSDGNSANDQYWGLSVSDFLEPEFRLQAGGTWNKISALGTVSPGKWYHLVGTYDGTTMRLYVNGNEVASEVHPTGGDLDQDSGATVTIGDSSVSGRPFDGRIDDVQIMSRVMCPEEARGLYKGGRPAGIRILKWVEVR